MRILEGYKAAFSNDLCNKHPNAQCQKFRNNRKAVKYVYYEILAKTKPEGISRITRYYHINNAHYMPLAL